MPTMTSKSKRSEQLKDLSTDELVEKVIELEDLTSTLTVVTSKLVKTISRN